MGKDPALGGKRTERTLRWKDSGDEKPQRSKPPHWLVELARWLADTGRGVMWLLGAIGVALFAVFVWRWARVRSDVLRARAALLPSHVNELDIRPESLPDDIGGAARVLWQRGETRAALSLLYRGALSRLVHDHRATIRASSTEGECVQLAHAVLPAAGSVYFQQLVRAWQTEVYAGRGADAALIGSLCTAFDAHFAPRATAAAPVLRAAESVA